MRGCVHMPACLCSCVRVSARGRASCEGTTVEMPTHSCPVHCILSKCASPSRIPATPSYRMRSLTPFSLHINSSPTPSSAPSPPSPPPPPPPHRLDRRHGAGGGGSEPPGAAWVPSVAAGAGNCAPSIVTAVTVALAVICLSAVSASERLRRGRREGGGVGVGTGEGGGGTSE